MKEQIKQIISPKSCKLYRFITASNNICTLMILGNTKLLQK